MTSETASGSVVLPPWQCPECGHSNLHTVARCQRRTFDTNHPSYEVVPPVPPGVKLADHLEKLGIHPTPIPYTQCSYTRPCDLCERPGRPHSGGESRCDDHPLQEANVWTRQPRKR